MQNYVFRFYGRPLIVPKEIRISLTDTKIYAENDYGSILDGCIPFFVFEYKNDTYIMPIPFDEKVVYRLYTFRTDKGPL